MNTLIQPRVAFALLFAACAGLIAYALYMQYALNLDPCPMCILQRYAFIAVGSVALIAAIHDPRALALKIYAGLVIVFAFTGAGIAIRHSYLQRVPSASTGCGADLGYLFETLPLANALPAIFRGTGECSQVKWTFMGLSIPEWALVWFVIFIVLTFVVLLSSQRKLGSRF